MAYHIVGFEPLERCGLCRIEPELPGLFAEEIALFSVVVEAAGLRLDSPAGARIRGLRGASLVKSLPAIFFFILYVFRIGRGVRLPYQNLSAFPIIVALPNLYLSAMRAE